MKDAFIICTDGLKGFPEAIEAVFPNTLVQTCIVHLVRASLKFVSWKERRAMAADLKTIYRAATAEMAGLALEELGDPIRMLTRKTNVMSFIFRLNCLLR